MAFSSIPQMGRKLESLLFTSRSRPVPQPQDHTAPCVIQIIVHNNVIIHAYVVLVTGGGYNLLRCTLGTGIVHCMLISCSSYRRYIHAIAAGLLKDYNPEIVYIEMYT